jgi:predicted metal-binding membrane protein
VTQVGDAGVAAPIGYRLTPTSTAALAVGAVAWAGVIAVASHMGNSSGTMGLSLLEFCAMWGLMMTAMMLPAVAPVASLYARTIRTDRTRRTATFVLGYLVAWTAFAVPAFLTLRVIDRIADTERDLRVVAVPVLLAAGLYQMTPLKRICIRHCRSPLAQLLHYGSITGRMRELRVALHHSVFCLGCCWALMALFLAFGVMNIWVMIALAAIVVIEKTWRHGEAFGQIAGIAFILAGLLVAISPAASDALLPSPAGDMDMPSM